jgi:hypothetical protein
VRIWTPTSRRTRKRKERVEASPFELGSAYVEYLEAPGTGGVACLFNEAALA